MNDSQGRAIAVKIVVVSDTHGRHGELGLLSGDVLIHCGDVFNAFEENADEMAELDAWFGQQRFARILCIGGNHDYTLQALAARADRPLRNAEYLEDRGLEYRGTRFYGSPWTPELEGWAYYLPDGDLESRWASIPDDTDILITHTPPYSVLDRNSSGKRCGCHHLRERVDRIRPALHCFGHVHASAGIHRDGRTTFANASMVNSQYEIARSPLEFEL